MKTHCSVLLWICLAIPLSGCALAGPGAGEPTPAATPILITTAQVSTAIVSTVEPGNAGTQPPPNFTPQPTSAPPTLTPIPTLPGGLGPTELKYRILAQFPDFFFCDPDYYPVAREDELDLARQRFPELQGNPEEFPAILAHNRLAGLSTFRDDQKLLIYREHKKLAAIPFELTSGGYRFQIQVAKAEGSGETVAGLIDGQGTITVQERKPSIAACPICLAAGALIDTPSGPIPVQELRLGELVWTLDGSGKRVARPVARLGKTIVPAGYQVVHLVLEDGRELWVSPGHPLPGGRRAGQLQAGDVMDGAPVLSVQRVPYTGSATYDLLPEGETGFYWANGILLSSTLK